MDHLISLLNWRQRVSDDRQFEALGKSGVSEGKLERFRKPEGLLREITMVSDEVTALCPITGQPDWYTVTIRYGPQSWCLESKSLKLYLHSLRDKGAFGEDLACSILEDICTAIIPLRCTVEVLQKPRGGISILSEARYFGELA